MNEPQAPSGFRDIEHLFRPVILAVLAVLAFLGIRAALVPDDFGVYGHYRAGALEDNRARQPVFAGRELCVECHDDIADLRIGSAHEEVGCEACHGALGSHADDPIEVVPLRPEPATLCLRCHGYSSYRPAEFPQVVVADHAMDEPCDSCHDPHVPGIE